MAIIVRNVHTVLPKGLFGKPEELQVFEKAERHCLWDVAHFNV